VAHIAVGLDVAHAAGVVHGALTPAAVLFDDDRAALTWIVAADPIHEGYVAPEVAAGAPPTVGSDVYGLASIALACLTGADPPVRADDVQVPGTTPVSAGVAWAIRLGRAADPGGRPRTAMMFAQMLKRAAATVHSSRS
jgi:serine/threonine protein kinase